MGAVFDFQQAPLSIPAVDVLYFGGDGKGQADAQLRIGLAEYFQMAEADLTDRSVVVLLQKDVPNTQFVGKTLSICGWVAGVWDGKGNGGISVLRLVGVEVVFVLS